MTRQPSALFVVDVVKEHIAVHEAKRLGIPVFAMVDTNSDPADIDFVIPANDDAAKSISLIIDIMCKAVAEGLDERKAEKDKESTSADTDEVSGKAGKGKFTVSDYDEEKAEVSDEAPVEDEEEVAEKAGEKADADAAEEKE